MVNVDPDTAHGLVITGSGAASTWMPMMTARPAFPGPALWFLGNPTPAGMRARTLTFTASTRGTYRYPCRSPAMRRRHGRPLHCTVIRLNADVRTPTFWIAAGPSARCQGTEVSTPRG